MLNILKSSVCAVILSGVLLSGAFAGEVKSIAILTPEEGTDFGWNQVGFQRGHPEVGARIGRQQRKRKNQ